MHKVDLPTLTIFIFSLRPLTANLMVFEEKSLGKQSNKKVLLSVCDETLVVFYSALRRLQPCSFRVTIQLRPINGTVAVFFPLVFKSIDPLNVFVFENIVN